MFSKPLPFLIILFLNSFAIYANTDVVKKETGPISKVAQKTSSKSKETRLFKYLSFSTDGKTIDLEKVLVYPPKDLYKLRPNFGYFPPSTSGHRCRIFCTKYFVNTLKFHLTPNPDNTKSSPSERRGGINYFFNECYQQCLCSYDWSKREVHLKNMCDSRLKMGKLITSRSDYPIAYTGKKPNRVSSSSIKTSKDNKVSSPSVNTKSDASGKIKS